MGFIFQSGATLIAMLLGLCVGSFSNVVIHRLPIMMLAEQEDDRASLNLCFPASNCPTCDHALRVRDNIPLLSYVLLRGRCAFCGAPISLRYPAVEGVMALMFGGLAYWLGWSWHGLGMAGLGAVLLVLLLIDLEHMLLPDSLTLGLLWCGLLFNLRGGLVPLPLAVCGAALGYGFFWAVARIAAWIARRESLGMGDAKLLAALGAWVGVKALPCVVVLAAMLTLLGFWVTAGSRRLPFGPGLAVAGFAIALGSC
ncbi:prepilin peptidase [Chromobacterium violaceum]|uniref:prepilin peptidase n=1 Tax=Chromobacterium violaceum TaxID=536 RepID=UPI0005D3AFA1|nr:A24 family peptidase [Chromobacterium violaceum]